MVPLLTLRNQHWNISINHTPDLTRISLAFPVLLFSVPGYHSMFGSSQFCLYFADTACLWAEGHISFPCHNRSHQHASSDRKEQAEVLLPQPLNCWMLKISTARPETHERGGWAAAPSHTDTQALSHNDPWPTNATLKEAEFTWIRGQKWILPVMSSFLNSLSSYLWAPYTASKSLEYKIRAEN